MGLLFLAAGGLLSLVLFPVKLYATHKVEQWIFDVVDSYLRRMLYRQIPFLAKGGFEWV